MPKPNKFSYAKREPFRDAFFFIIVCEGAEREIAYFNFFDGMSSRVKLVPVTNERGSAPNLLVEAAVKIEEQLKADPSEDQVWFVIDTDRWRDHLHEIREECSQRPHWQVVQSNPCFEVWLYFHAKPKIPAIDKLNQCQAWKNHLHEVIKGGFNSDFHPVAINAATINAKATYQETGYFPDPGSTQLWQLTESLLPLISKDLDLLKHKFPPPVVIEQ